MTRAPERASQKVKLGDPWTCVVCERQLPNQLPRMSFLCGYRPIHICGFCWGWRQGHGTPWFYT